MDYDELVVKVIELLQREKRVPYRVLKRRFDLDDDYLEDLKIDLIEAKRLALDENDRILVWIGDTQEVTTPSAQAIQPPAAQEQQSPQGPPRPTVPPPEAERRQLTVMFCDLVDSTILSSQLDPEDYRQVVRAYQQVCSEVIQHYEGHVAQLLGDGLLVYFGYPHAHEDDAQRAIRTGLGIIEAIGSLNTRLEQGKGITLAVRLGIHTGLVVVGAMGGEGRQEQLALGDVPNIASRIQGLAAPNTVFMSDATHRLVQGYFECQELGEQELRGVSHPIAVYRVLQESGVQSRLDVASTRGLTPLVGREQAVGLLLERWQQAKGGQGQVILLSGEAGIGKSRLVQVLKDQVASEPHTRQECRCSPYHTHSAFFPLAELLQRRFGWQSEDTADEKLHKLETVLPQTHLDLNTAVPLFTALFSLPLPDDRYPPLQLSSQQQRQHTLDAFLQLLLLAAEQHPVLFIVEDLHWVDPSTLEFLELLIAQTPTTSLYLLATCRPEFQPPWSHRSYLTEMTITRLTRHQIERMATHVAGGKRLPADVLQQIVEKTDGVPLFVEECTKAVLESGVLKETNEQYELAGALTPVVIPATLHDSLMARLDRLMTAKVIAQLGATIGRQFSYALLKAVSQGDEATLRTDVSRLVEAEIVYQRGVQHQATYTFKHALIRDIAYESLLKSTRQQYHQRIAQVLEAQFPETAETEPELVAHHYTAAGLTEQAVSYWHKAGQRASERSAHVEAISHLTKGLELLKILPETPQRLQRELDLLIALGASLLAVKGYAAGAVRETYTYARQLCQHLEDPYQLFPVLRGLHMYYHVRAELQTAHTLGEQLLALALQVQDAAMLVAAHRALGTTLAFVGVPASAHTHLTQGMVQYDLQQHRAYAWLYGEDAGVFCRSQGARTLWHLGYPDQALAWNEAAVMLAQQIAHPFSLSFALSAAAMFHQLRREVRLTHKRAEAAISLAQEQGFPFWLALATILRGWTLAQRGEAQAGIEQMSQGLTAWRATGAELLHPYFLALLADVHGTLGEPEAGLTVVTEALTLMDTTGERWYEPELHHLQGELLLQQSSDHHPEAVSCFQQAIRIAQHQQAKSWELRASTSLARLWQSQGKRAEARQVLGDIYGWFTEGFDTADLQEAKVLLEELRA